ncbi:hypothetical protein [Lacipirellula parvula]|uniref:PEP-CTERM protein-sorting domain-containing protein n=1 Tax=Lacipirellula parvula TaxID=2650471 RepID=A0A5K7X5J8_9BACT|nr:hypothetical protein [Lacipirellula parvula]BBO31994.1 hypothetical protein PLANPX_1606 [Lacipirellula parvula]
MNGARLITCLLFVALTAAPARAAVTQTTYRINPGGQYEYKPSPWIGIPGGVPSPFELDFGIGGTFIYELDATAKTARLLNLDLSLNGNEAIQTQSPTPGLVNAPNIERFLNSRLFVEDFLGGLLHLKSSDYSNLKLTDSLNGNLTLLGGFNNTPADGDGVFFNFSAVAIPEPTAATLVALASIVGLFFKRLA